MRPCFIILHFWLISLGVLKQGKIQSLIGSDNSIERIEMVDGCIAQLDQGLGDLQLLQKLMILCQHHRLTEPETSDITSSAQAWDSATRADQLFNCLNNVLQSDKVCLFQILVLLFIFWVRIPSFLHMDFSFYGNYSLVLTGGMEMFFHFYYVSDTHKTIM